MPTLPPQTQHWPADRAILFVHGIGNARPGDYDTLVSQVQQLLGDSSSRFAFYFLYYDQIDQWAAAKLQASLLNSRVVDAIRRGLAGSQLLAGAASKVDPVTLANVIADFAGDVVWPVFVPDARRAVRAAFLQQLAQIVLDGKSAGLETWEQHLTIITHSLGCFHTYEALAAIANDPTEGLSPATYGVQFDNVIYMASPLQLIRSVCESVGAAVPERDSLHCLSVADFRSPAEHPITGPDVPSARRVVSITGNLDPVGGWFLRNRADWAYMKLPDPDPAARPEYVSLIDDQQLNALKAAEDSALAAVLQSALRTDAAPQITLNNPHDWGAYVARHGDQLKKWLIA
jgi:hypothetical protein